MDEPTTWLRRLLIVDNFVDRMVDIDVQPAPHLAFRHLVLTGRNGCGKTATLVGLSSNPVDEQRHTPLTVEGNAVWKESGIEGVPRAANHAPIAIDRRATEGPWHGLSVVHFFPARRTLKMADVSGPTQEVRPQGVERLEQLLVNWRTQLSFARETGDEARITEYTHRLAHFEDQLRDLFDPIPLALEFHGPSMHYFLQIDGVRTHFKNLPDGFAAALQMWLDTWTRLEHRGPDAGGIVLIDEPESHLHPGLQEKILPFLARAFPTVQLVVATHSPIIVASLDNSLVYDLSTKESWYSEDFRAWRYGRVMTGLFGLDDEYSSAVTAELNRMEELRDKPDRTTRETEELRTLAQRLRSSSHAMALEVWLRLQHPEILADSRP